MLQQRDKKGRFEKGSPSPRRGKRLSPETIEKIKLAKLDIKITTAERTKICETCRQPFISKGRDRPKIAKQLFCSKQCQRSSPRIRAMLSKLWRGKKHKPETIAKMKAAKNAARYRPLSEHPNWRGGTFVKDGYCYVKAPGHPHAMKSGYIFQHRLVAEEKLGRYLEPHEVVHHINGNKLDNRPENLKVFADSRDHHLFVHLERCPNCGFYLRQAA